MFIHVFIVHSFIIQCYILFIIYSYYQKCWMSFYKMLNYINYNCRLLFIGSFVITFFKHIDYLFTIHS